MNIGEIHAIIFKRMKIGNVAIKMCSLFGGNNETSECLMPNDDS